MFGGRRQFGELAGRSRPVSDTEIAGKIATTPVPRKDLFFRLPPTFDNVADERRHRKERLTAALRLFGKFGFEEGVAGHITARDPELTDHFWVNPFGMSFKHIRVSDLILVNHKGEVVEGRHPVNEAAFAIHSQVHQARPEEGKRIAAALGGNKAVILRNHGLLTVGTTVDAAAWWFITMERSCQVQLLAKAAGMVVPLSPDNAARTHEQIGSEIAGWFNYQPLYDQITREQGDLFD